MLTKQEREEISKRFGECDDVGFYDLYTAITGKKVPSRTTRDEDFTKISNVILDLCDTSSMVELPIDKDGKVIHIGDTVFDDYGKKWVVNGISFKSNGVLIDTYLDGECAKFLPSELTYKQPATIESLAERIRDVLENTDVVDALDDFRTGKFYDELLAICGELERLSDNDE
jgi:hypothetical protein